MVHAPFIWGRAGAKLTPDQVAREREAADLLAKGAMDFSPVAHWSQGLGRVAQGLLAGLDYRRAAQGEEQIAGANKNLVAALLGGSSAATPAASSAIPMTSAAGEVAATAPRASAVTPMFADDGTELGSILSDPERRATLPAGMRNNNPGNIKFVGQKVPGIVGPSVNTDQGDPQAVFATPEAGMNAMYQLALKKYNSGKTTADKLIAGNMGWTPGNHQAAANVAASMGLSPDDDINLNDPVMAAKFLRGLIIQEHGKSGALYPESMILSAITGQPTQVASATPQTATDAIEAIAPLQPTPEAIMSFAGQERTPPVSLTDEVLAFQQTPEANAAFPGRANRTVAEPQLMADFSGSNQLSNAQSGIIPALTGGIPASPEQIARAQAAAQAPIEVAGGGDRVPMAATSNAGTSGVNPAIIEALTNPQATPQTQRLAAILLEQEQRKQQALAEQQAQAADPLRALQIRKAQAELDAMGRPDANLPDSVRALNIRAQQAGLQPGTPEYQRFMLSGGDKGITINNEGTIPAGYQAVRDAEGRVTSIQPIPGSPAALEMEQALKTKENQGGRKETATDVITNAASNARNILKNNSLVTGTPGKLASYLSESPAAELRRQVGVLKSQATIETLTAMRQASPTGGALGSVTEKEGAMLAAAAGAIDPDASLPDVQKALDNYEHTLLRVIHGPKVGDAIFEQTRQEKTISEMTDEELEALANGD